MLIQSVHENPDIFRNRRYRKKNQKGTTENIGHRQYTSIIVSLSVSYTL